MKLVIVESPTKAKTIHKYLGKDYVVKSSYGHVRDLPVKPGRQKTKEEVMGIDPSKGWKANYEILPGKTRVIRELKDTAKKAEGIYLAADPDREGEAIAWHLSEILNKPPESFHRVVYHEITKKSVQKAFENPGVINHALVNAYKARRFLDRVVGFEISPLLWKYIARGLSAGRVQSVAVRLVVEREKEIKAFTPEEYWSLNALLSQKIDDAEDFKAEVLRYRDKKLQVHNADQAGKAQKELESSPFRVIEREDKPTRSRPYPPFVTSTLQQAASVRLGFGVARTMRLAQRLYENGYITYMRTDSTRLSDEAVFGIRSFIQQNFGLDYLPESKRVYSSKALAQEAHEAIRPSDISVTADSLKADNDAKKLYDLIWRQTMASQMKDAEFDTSSVRIEAGDYELRARGRVMRFDGWQKVLPQKVREGELADLPPLKAGEDLRLNKVMSQQHFTKPPPRYSEASLVKELEKRGIGRPSTYAQIISTIQDRGYVQQQRRRFHAEKIGEIVTFQLMKSFPDLMDYRFTAQLEERLDRIASEEMEWQEVLDLFYRDFQKKTAAVEKEKMLKIEPPEVDIPCAECGRPMLLYVGKNGTFLGCSGYRLAKDKKCRFTRNLVRIETPSRPQQNGDEDEGNVDELLQKKRCPRCGMAMDIWQVDDTMRLHLCGNSPLCGGALLEKGDFSSPGGEKEGEAIHCDKCGKIMVRKEGRFGPYYACSEAPKCKNTRKILKSGKVAPPRAEPVKLEDVPCPKCSASMVLREGARGLFLACSKFPWCKGSGNVPVDVLRRYRDRLEKKFQGLIDGPEKCPQCEQRVMLHWSVKGKRYYYSCENRKCKWIQNLEPAAKTEEKS